MAITYDKKFLKWYSTFDKKKIRKEAFKRSIFFAFWIPAWFYFINLISKDRLFPDLNFLDYFLLFLFAFIFNYFTTKWELKRMKKTYDESMAHWQKHDPSFFDQPGKSQDI
jgi:hypothetical protein